MKNRVRLEKLHFGHICGKIPAEDTEYHHFKKETYELLQHPAPAAHFLVGLRLGMLVVGFLLASCRSNPQAM